MNTEAQTPTHAAILKRWQALTTHLTTEFHKPDIEALEVALSAAAAHYCIQQDPVWLFVVGPSSSGKTSVVITALEGFGQDALTMGDLTPKTFISHFQGQGGKSKGLLHDIGKHKILLWKDFTTFISKKDDDKLSIGSQLREIYDGKIVRHTGVGAEPEWEGLITIVAAATPAIERAWSIMRDLGERFVMVRWPYLGESEIARVANKQRGREREIAATTRRLTHEFIMPSRLMVRGNFGPLPDETLDRVISYAQLTARLRGHVIRDSHGSREIIDVPSIEESGRLSKTLGLLVSAHAALWEREPGLDDLRIAKRVALDSIPERRRRVFECIPDGSSISRMEVARLTEIPPATVLWIAQELQALGVIELVTDGIGESMMSFTPKFARTKAAAFPSTL